MEKVWRRVGLRPSRRKREPDRNTGRSNDGQSTSAEQPREVEYQNVHTFRTADLIRQRQAEENSTLRSSYIIKNGENFILVERRRRRRRRSGTRKSSASRLAEELGEASRPIEQKRPPPRRLKIFGIHWPLHSSTNRARSTSISRRLCRGRRSRDDNELYRSNSFKFERFVREKPDEAAGSQAGLCSDYSLPLDCVGATSATTSRSARPASLYAPEPPNIEILEAYCEPRDTTSQHRPTRGSPPPDLRASPPRSTLRSSLPRSTLRSSIQRSTRRSSPRSTLRSSPPRSTLRSSPLRSTLRSSPPRSTLRSSGPRSTVRSSLRSASLAARSPEPHDESPPEPAPGASFYCHRPYSHPYFDSESSSEERSSDEEEDFGAYDGSGAAPALQSPESAREVPPRRNPSPYYYADLFRAPPPRLPRAPRYRKSASLDAPHVAPRVRLPKRFSVAEDGLHRELDSASHSDSSHSSRERERMPPRRRACACAAAADDAPEEPFRPARSVFYAPIPPAISIAPTDMATRELYETAFDCKIARSDDDLDDFDRVSNHPAFLQGAERSIASSSSSAVDGQMLKSRRKVTLKTDSVKRLKEIRQKQAEKSNESLLCQELASVHISDSDPKASTSQLPLRGFTPSPPSTAPLPTKFQQSKDSLAMNSIKSAPNLPSQPAHPRLKDLRLPVKSLRARETPMSSDASINETQTETEPNNDDFELGNRLRNMIQESQNRMAESKGRPRLNNGLFLEIKGRPTSDSDTPKTNRSRGSKESGPILEFKGRPSNRHIRHKYSSSESMATSSSGGSMESLRSSTSEGNRSTSSSDSRHSSSLSSHSGDSGSGSGFHKLHRIPLSGFLSHHANKLHVLSPISDKSSQEPGSETSDLNRNNNSQKVSPEDSENMTTSALPGNTDLGFTMKAKRRLAQNKNLLNLAFQNSMAGEAEIQGSDSGISIHSRDGVNSRNAFIGFTKSNKNQADICSKNLPSEVISTNQDLSDLPFDMPKLRRRRAANINDISTSGSITSVDLFNLPFDMPKLRRKLRGQSLPINADYTRGSQASSSQSVQELEQGNHRPNLTLDFANNSRNSNSGYTEKTSSGGLNLNFGVFTNAPVAIDMIDSNMPLERQSWYHGALSRAEAERELRAAQEGAFLVRNSESNKQDYSLSLKSARGFMHMRIQRAADGQYILGAFSPPFSSVPAVLRHYAANRLPVRGAEHMCLAHPLAAQML